ncbi:hypothetical protein HF072_00655 [Bacillus sp. RO3]|nr:hypothetical protein [Bacillus sp. RO3]
MEKLLLTIIEDIKKRKLNKKSISASLPISAAALGKNLNGVSAFDFFNYILMIKVIYKDEVDIQKKRIREFFLKNKKPQNFKYMLEWASNNGEDELLTLLNKRLEKDTYYSGSAEMYSLLQLRKSEEISSMDFLMRVKSLKLGSEEVVESRSLKNILDIYALWDLKAYTAIEPHSNLALQYLKDNVSPSYSRDSHELRILEMRLSGMIKRNNQLGVEKTIEDIFAKKNLSEFPIQLNSIYLTIAEFYSPSDFDLSKKFLEKAFQIDNELLKKHKRRLRSLEATHDHIHISNGSYDNLFMTDQSEVAHYFAKTGEVNHAIEILDYMELKHNGLSPYQKFYKAIALNDKQLFKEAFDDFIYSGDIFYSQVVAKQLF